MFNRVLRPSERGPRNSPPRWRKTLSIAGLVALAVVPVLAVGCTKSSPAPVPQKTQEAVATDPVAPDPATPTATSVPVPEPTATLVPVAVDTTPQESPDIAEEIDEIELAETLFLEVVEPADESIVEDAPLALVGRTTPDAVVSVQGETVDVGPDGQFVALVSLEPGPNVIEVVASDLTGQAETSVLAVIYIP